MTKNITSSNNLALNRECTVFLYFINQVIGYPSIKVFRRGNEEIDYWGDNNEEDITDFIESNVLQKSNEL